MTQKRPKTEPNGIPVDETISIIVASNDHYAVLVGALLRSIDENHKTGEHIDFYIIDDHISSANKNKLNQVADPNRISLKWIDSAAAVPKNMKLPSDSSSFPKTIYYRIFAPYLVDRNVGKLIYIDVDTIVRTDISLLWQVDLEDYTIAAVQDIGKTVKSPWGGIPNYAELGLPADTLYFNSGLLVMNTEKWRGEAITSQVIDVLINNRKHVVLPDQYGLNVVFANNWKALDQGWNWSAYSARHQNPNIIHFLHIKPIFKSCYAKEHWKNEFYRYLNETPWKGFRPINEYKRRMRLLINKSKKFLRKWF